MITLLKPLLVNITILFSLTFNANLFFTFHSKLTYSFKNKAYFGFIGTLGALFCMLYPIETLGDTHFDFRMIVILVITMYGGWVSGSIVVMSVTIYRYVLGGEFYLVGISVSLLAYIVAIVFRLWFLKSKRRLVTGTMIAAVYFSLYILIIYLSIHFLDRAFYSIYFISFYFTYIALIYVIERLNRINKRMEEMVYVDKLNMVGQMAASIAHEIRNPLTTVRGFIQYLSQNTKDEQFEKFSPLIMEELDRTNKIITDYLNVAKQEPFQLSNVSISKLINDCVQLMRPLASYSNVVIDFEYKASYHIQADEHHLKQAIMNVIKNGIEAIPEKGIVKIDVDQDPFEGNIVITIMDNGRGMTVEELKQLGLPFYTTKSLGTGLGSMITNKIIRELNGTIEYESEVGKGTSVKITLNNMMKYN